MPYQIIIKKSASKQILSLPKNVKDAIFFHIFELEEDPRPTGCKKLKGSDEYWRIRVGDYRIIYSIFDVVLTIEVIRVSHRKDAYK